MRLAEAVFSLVVASALSSCAPSVVVRTVCPPVVTYDQPFQTRLADEIDSLKDNSAVKQAVVDYHQLRNVIRACEAN